MLKSCLYKKFSFLSFSICASFTVTRRVKGYTEFAGKYLTGRSKRFRSHKVYIFLIRITGRMNVDLTKSLISIAGSIYSGVQV